MGILCCRLDDKMDELASHLEETAGLRFVRWVEITTGGDLRTEALGFKIVDCQHELMVEGSSYLTRAAGVDPKGLVGRAGMPDGVVL